MYFRFLTISFFYHYEVKNENGSFSLLYALFSPFWPCLLHSIVQRFHLVALKEFQHPCPIIFLCYFPILSNVFIWVTCLPDPWIKISHEYNFSLPFTFVDLLLSLRTSLRTFSASLLPYSSTLGACRCFLRKMFRSPLPWYPYSYDFVIFCVFDHLCYVTQDLLD